MIRIKTNQFGFTGITDCTSNEKCVINRNLTVSPCGRSAGTVPEPPELDT